MFSPDKVERIFAEIDELSHCGSAIGLAFKRGTPALTHFSYPADFLEEYNRLELARSDATLLFGFQNDGVAQWRELEQGATDRHAFAVARFHGIEDGICFAMTIEGKKTIASVSQDPKKPLGECEIEQIFDLLTLASVYATRQTSEVSYSCKAYEWLALTASGLKDGEIAERLGLSIHGSRARRKAALFEIDAKTPAHAVLKAVQAGRLNPYEIV